MARQTEANRAFQFMLKHVKKTTFPYTFCIWPELLQERGGCDQAPVGPMSHILDNSEQMDQLLEELSIAYT